MRPKKTVLDLPQTVPRPTQKIPGTGVFRTRSLPKRDPEYYLNFLATAPPKGAGLAHSWLLSAANKARLAGRTEHEATEEIHRAIPRRAMREVVDAVRKAYASDFQPRGHVDLPPPKQIDSKRFWADVLQRYPDPGAQLWEASPIRLLNPDRDFSLVLEYLYRPDDLLFIGGLERGTLGGTIRPASAWRNYTGRLPEFFGPNPLTGKPSITPDGTLVTDKFGRPIYRCDATAIRRFVVIEFDKKPLEWQAAFWCHMIELGEPVALVVQSGNKSLHGWVRATDDRVPKLFSLLPEIGADHQTKNRSRSSRTPGAIRKDTGKQQCLLYLNPRHGENP